MKGVNHPAMTTNTSLKLEDRADETVIQDGSYFSLPEAPADFALTPKEEPVGDLHLRFFVPSGKEYALPAVEIREVLECPPDRINPMPNTSPLILGMINLRGRVIWVCDLGQFLGDRIPVNTDRAELPVVAIESGGMVLGAVVDRIGVVAWLEPEKLKPLPRASHPFIKGEWQLPDTNESIKLLSAEEILLSPRWVSP